MTPEKRKETKHSIFWWAASLAASGICIAVICGAVPWDKAKDVLLFMAICVAIEEGRTLRRIIEKTRRPSYD